MTGFTEILCAFACAVADFFSAAEGTFVSIAAIVAAGATIVMAVVAVLGLHRWKSQLMGKENLEVARNLLRAAYKIQEAIEVCRDTYLPVHEYPEGYEHMSTDKKKHADALIHVYNKRWERVWNVRQEFDAAVLEAKVLWGRDFVAKAEEIRSCTRELRMAIRLYIRDEMSGGSIFKRDEKHGEKMLAIVGHYSEQAVFVDGELVDLFAERVENVVVEFDEHVRSYMPTRTDQRNRT